MIEFPTERPERECKFPTIHAPTANRYAEDPDSLPYEVPTKGSKDMCRDKHRTWYWLKHDYWTYECPDCDRTVDECRSFDVHHKDGDVHNGRPENLVALCRRCHIWRHRTGTTVKGLTIDEWKDGFRKLGGGA